MAVELGVPLKIRRLWGRNLRRARVRSGWTQAELAEIVGCTRQAVSSWERGISAPSYGARVELARLFGAELLPAA